SQLDCTAPKGVFMSGSNDSTAILSFSQHGSPEEVLVRKQSAPRDPGPGEVRVRMRAAPVNPSDLLFIRGTYGIRPQLPARAGFEGTGMVEASGGGLLGTLFRGRRVAVAS